MAKIINISDKLSNERPKIQIGDKSYEVNNSVEVVLKFGELQESGTTDALLKAFELALGKEAADELQIIKMPFDNLKVWTIAIMASMQGLEYDEAASRFLDKDE